MAYQWNNFVRFASICRHQVISSLKREVIHQCVEASRPIYWKCLWFFVCCFYASAPISNRCEVNFKQTFCIFKRKKLFEYFYKTAQKEKKKSVAKRPDDSKVGSQTETTWSVVLIVHVAVLLLLPRRCKVVVFSDILIHFNLWQGAFAKFSSSSHANHQSISPKHAAV